LKIRLLTAHTPTRLQRENLLKIRNAQPLPCQEANLRLREDDSASTSTGLGTYLYEDLIVWFPSLYAAGRLLSLAGSKAVRIFPPRSRCQHKAMHLTSLHYLLLIPVGLGLAFMLWVLWSVSGQLTKRRVPPEKRQPVISVGVRDRYSLDRPAPPLRSVQVAPPVVQGTEPSGARGHSAPREYSYVPPPTLGMGFRSTSSSTVRGVRR